MRGNRANLQERYPFGINIITSVHCVPAYSRVVLRQVLWAMTRPVGGAFLYFL